MEPEFVNESMWDDDDEGANNDETNFGEDDSNMEMTGFDGSATGDGNMSGGGEGGAVGDAQDTRRFIWSFFNRQNYNIVCKICLSEIEDMVLHLKTKHQDFYTEIYYLIKNDFRIRYRYDRCWVKKYCINVSQNKNKCSICRNVLTIPKGLYGNMRRHFLRKHPIVYAVEMEMKINSEQSEDEYKDVAAKSYGEEKNREKLEEACVTSDTTNDVSEVLMLGNIEENDANSKNIQDQESCQSPVLEETIYQDINDLDTESEISDNDDINYATERKILPQKVLPETGAFTGLRRGWVKKYCIRISDSETKCSICRNVLKMAKGVYGNMKRHVIRKHRDVYEMEVQMNSDQSEDDSTDVKDKSASYVEEEIREENVCQDGDDVDTKSETPPKRKDAYHDSKIKSLSPGKDAYTGSKRCWIKNYCVKIGEKKYRCNICRNVLRMPTGLYGNMKRHVQRKHPKAYEYEMEMQINSERSEDDAKDVKGQFTTYCEEQAPRENVPELKNIEGSDANSKNTQGQESCQSPVLEETLYQDDEDLDTESESSDIEGSDYTFERDPFDDSKIIRRSGTEGKRSFYWNFFERNESNILRCKICSSEIKCHMVRHFKTKHRALYLKINPTIKKKIPADTVSKRYCWVRKYCVYIGENQNQCNICQSILKMPKGFYGNMKRHILTKHPKVYEMEKQNTEQSDNDFKDVDANRYSEEEILEEEVLDLENFEESDPISKNTQDQESCQSPILEEIVYQDIDDLDTESETPDFGNDIDYISESDPFHDSKIKWLSQRAVPGKSGKIKTCVWNFFKESEDNRVYTCIFCRNNICIFPQSSSNLKRHLEKKHNNQFNLIVKYAPEFREKKNIQSLRKLMETVNRADDLTKNFESSYFEEQGDKKFKCKSCEEIVECTEPESLKLYKHIHEKHADEVIGHIQETVDDDEEISVLFVSKKDMPV